MYGPGRAELALALHASGAESSSGVSTAIDLADGSAYVGGCGARSLALLDLDVTAASGPTPTLAITLETSRDGANWHAVPTGGFDVLSAAGWQRRAFIDLDRYVRARWTISASASFTFAVSGSAVLVYAGLAQVSSLAMRAEAVSDLSIEEKADALVAASDEADIDVGERYQLPLVRWPTSLSRHVGSIASLIMMSSNGYAPQPGARDTFKDGHDRAKAFLKQVFTVGDQAIVAQLAPADFQTGGTNPVEREWTSRGWAR